MSFLVTGDLHLTSNVRDEYRWHFLEWLLQQVHIYNVPTVYILGDLTDRKDCHPAALVNRLVVKLERFYPTRIIALMGNHDYIEETNPFFSFLNSVNNVRFVVYEGELDETIYALPHSRKFNNPDFEYNHEWVGPRRTPYPYVFVHGTITGARLDAHKPELRGIPKIAFHPKSRVFAGDIHVPQDIGDNITYVGAPYPINFDDTYAPRVILVDDGTERDLFPPSIQKRHLIVRNAEELAQKIESFELGENDQVKITVELDRDEFHEWKNIRKSVLTISEESGMSLCGISMRETTKIEPKLERERFDSEPGNGKSSFKKFCSATGVSPELMETGQKLLE